MGDQQGWLGPAAEQVRRLPASAVVIPAKVGTQPRSRLAGMTLVRRSVRQIFAYSARAVAQ